MLNSNATFFVVASGLPILTYRWNFNGVPITNAISTRSSFTVTNVTATNRGPYTVTVSNSKGSVTSTQVFVVFSPSIVSQPAAMSPTLYTIGNGLRRCRLA